MSEKPLNEHTHPGQMIEVLGDHFSWDLGERYPKVVRYIGDLLNYIAQLEADLAEAQKCLDAHLKLAGDECPLCACEAQVEALRDGIRLLGHGSPKERLEYCQEHNLIEDWSYETSVDYHWRKVIADALLQSPERSDGQSEGSE